MAENTQYIFEINSHEFAEKVINASHKSIVIVDFWADWCAPCKMLGPVLERIVKSHGGRVILVKVNIDDNSDLAMQYGIKSIPSVKIFKDGSVVKEFVGVLPENNINTIIQSIVGDEIQEKLIEAVQLIEKNRFSEAELIYKSILEKNPNNSSARIEMARLALKIGKCDNVHELLGSIQEHEKEFEEAKTILFSLDFLETCENAGNLENCKERIKGNPDDLNVYYELGCCYAANEMYREALDTFLSIVKKDKKFGQGKAKDAMISLFTIVGETSSLTNEYRGRLAQELF